MKRRRYLMSIDLKNPTPVEEDLTVRNTSKKDRNRLGALIYSSYVGTPDYGGESLEEASIEGKNLFDGKYGPLIKQCSFVKEVDDELVAASMVTAKEDHNPLLAYVMTESKSKRQGIAKNLVLSSMNALLSDGYENLYLFVSADNKPAFEMYEKMGYKIVDEFYREIN